MPLVMPALLTQEVASHKGYKGVDHKRVNPLIRGSRLLCKVVDSLVRVEGSESWVQGETGVVGGLIAERSAPNFRVYRGTSLTRNAPLEPYRRPIPRVLGGS